MMLNIHFEAGSVIVPGLISAAFQSFYLKNTIILLQVQKDSLEPVGMKDILAIHPVEEFDRIHLIEADGGELVQYVGEISQGSRFLNSIRMTIFSLIQAA